MGKKHKTRLTLVSVLSIIDMIIVAIMGCFIYKYFKDEEKLNNMENELNIGINNSENIINNEKDKNEKSFENSGVSEELLNQLYKYILKSDDFKYSFAWSDFEPASFYKDTKTTYYSLSNMEKLLVVLKNYDASKIKNVNKSEVANVINIIDIHDNVDVYENINEKEKQIFNQNDSEWKNYTGVGAYLDYSNNSYYLSVFDGGGKGTSEIGYSQIQKVDKDEEYIYIYDKFIYVDSYNYDCNLNDSKIHIYTSSNKTTDIGSESEMFECDELYKKYENQLNIYKHTFKLAEDGTYYWMSSEIYK